MYDDTLLAQHRGTAAYQAEAFGLESIRHDVNAVKERAEFLEAGLDAFIFFRDRHGRLSEWQRATLNDLLAQYAACVSLRVEQTRLWENHAHSPVGQA